MAAMFSSSLHGRYAPSVTTTTTVIASPATARTANPMPAAPLSLSQRAPWTPIVTTTTTKKAEVLSFEAAGPSFKYEKSTERTVRYSQCRRFRAGAQDMPAYVVLGIFPDGHGHPREQVVLIKRPERFFRDLHWAAYELRGLSGTFFSLTHVREFRLYKCDEDGTHERVELDSSGTADMRLLLQTYRRWRVGDVVAKSWVDWIRQAINEGKSSPSEGRYSLELVLGWSATRISIVVLLPVLLSLAIGIYLNSQNWRDLATIQTAWGTASYVLTAGGLLAALLAILSSIEY